MESTLLEYTLLAVLGTAAVIDWRTYRIPNWLTGSAILVGISCHAISNQLNGFVFSLEGAVLGFGLFVIFYACGWMGAGDVKLFAAVGSFLGPAQTLSATIVIALIGGLLALGTLGLRLGWRKTGLWIWSYVQSIVLTRSVRGLTPVQSIAPKVPYAVAIGLGTIGSYWWYPLG